MMSNTNVFDIDMFKIVWKPVVSAIAYAFITFDDEYWRVWRSPTTGASLVFLINRYFAFFSVSMSPCSISSRC